LDSLHPPVACAATISPDDHDPPSLNAQNRCVYPRKRTLIRSRDFFRMNCGPSALQIRPSERLGVRSRLRMSREHTMDYVGPRVAPAMVNFFVEQKVRGASSE
jgi:hypothetical protein